MPVTSRPNKFFNEHFAVAATAVYLSLSVLKMRGYLLEGRFWAEEGVIFYRDLVDKPLLDGLFYLFHGHLELATNIVVWLSTLTSLETAPLVTTYLSFAIQSAPIALVVRYREALSLTRHRVILLIAIAAGLPQSTEVWANSINLHFHFCLVAALLAAIDVNTGPPKWASRLLLALAGLSGIPANFLVPVFALLAIRSRQSERWVQFAILTATAMLQISLLIANHFDAGQRDLFSTPLALWLAPVAQSVISPLFGAGIGQELTGILRDASNLKPAPILFAMVSSIPLAGFFAIMIANRSRPVGVVLFSAFTLLLLDTLTALGDKTALISAFGGGRYFYAPNLLFAIAFLAYIRKNRILGFSIVLMLSTSSAVTVMNNDKGPSWRSNFERPDRSELPTYSIWPSGWTMTLKNR